jgi:hypothetical protein
MPAALVTILAAAAQSCPELEVWRHCGSGGKEHCETCFLGGPARCEAQVIQALARRLAEATTKQI